MCLLLSAAGGWCMAARLDRPAVRVEAPQQMSGPAASDIAARAAWANAGAWADKQHLKRYLADPHLTLEQMRRDEIDGKVQGLQVQDYVTVAVRQKP